MEEVRCRVHFGAGILRPSDLNNESVVHRTLYSLHQSIVLSIFVGLAMEGVTFYEGRPRLDTNRPSNANAFQIGQASGLGGKLVFELVESVFSFS